MNNHITIEKSKRRKKKKKKTCKKKRIELSYEKKVKTRHRNMYGHMDVPAIGKINVQQYIDLPARIKRCI
jgi:hypothetical protein